MAKKWKTIKSFEYKSAEDCIKKLQNKGYRVCDWIKNIASFIEVDNHDYPLELWRVYVSDFDFDGPGKLEDIYDEFIVNGFTLVPPEIALYCRFIYDEQKKGEWLRIATPLNSMIDSDGIPHLPKLGCALGNYYLHTYWSYPKAIFHLHNEFVVCR